MISPRLLMDGIRHAGLSATLAAGIVLTAALPASARPAASTSPMTLDEALAYAAEHYPSVREAVARLEAAGADVSLARTAYLPRLDAVWQTNRATANNIFGQVLPQSAIPAMSGPVLGTTSAAGVWGTAAGALLSWDAYDFGLRASTVREAEAGVARSRSEEALTLLAVQGAVGTAYLQALAAEQAVASAEADLERRDVLARAAHVLVDNQLRAGAEASRADAERAAAQTRVVQARQAVMLARITLTRVLGLDQTTAAIAGDALVGSMPSIAPPSSAGQHPLLRARLAAVELSRAREDVLRKTDRPRILLQSALFARGSGANPDGSSDSGGLGLERANWATGVQVVFPNLFDAPNLRARRLAAAADTRAEEARAQEAALNVTAEQRAAQALVDAAVEIARNTPVQVAAARQTETQARARYDAGLASITEVAEAQSLLAGAEYQDALARVDVWRALLAQATALGDLTPFIERVRATGGR